MNDHRRQSRERLPATDSPPAMSGAGFATLLGCFFLLFGFYGGGYSAFVPVLDHANLAFHEAGHVFFGILGTTPGLYGGTLGQLVFPVAAAVSFIRKAALFPSALAMLWFFQNFLNIARYAGDARSRRLPLVGGGDHDWFNILFRWNALQSDTGIAAAFATIAWLGMLATVLWAGRLWIQTMNR